MYRITVNQQGCTDTNDSEEPHKVKEANGLVEVAAQDESWYLMVPVGRLFRIHEEQIKEETSSGD